MKAPLNASVRNTGDLLHYCKRFSVQSLVWLLKSASLCVSLGRKRWNCGMNFFCRYSLHWKSFFCLFFFLFVCLFVFQSFKWSSTCKARRPLGSFTPSSCEEAATARSVGLKTQFTRISEKLIFSVFSGSNNNKKKEHLWRGEARLKWKIIGKWQKSWRKNASVFCEGESKLENSWSKAKVQLTCIDRTWVGIEMLLFGRGGLSSLELCQQ